jgi:hypothetical protein
MFTHSKSIFVNGKQYIAFADFMADELRITCDGKEVYRDTPDEYTNFMGNMEAFLVDQSILGKE